MQQWLLAGGGRILLMLAAILVASLFSLTSCRSHSPVAVPTIGSAEWLAEVDSTLDIADPAGHGPDHGSDEWYRAVHRRLPSEKEGFRFEDIGTAAWMQHVHDVVFGRTD